MTASYEPISGKSAIANARAHYVLQTDGICEFSFYYANTESRHGLFAGWLLGGLGWMLNWIEAIRRAADLPAEFALAPQIVILGGDAALAEYGVSNFAEARGYEIPAGFHEFPIMSIGGADEFPQHLSRFDEDVWNLAGQDTRRTAAIFELDSD